MIIKYDLEVLKIAQRIAASRSATRQDVLKLIGMNDHIPAVRVRSHRENMPSSNYLGREVKGMIVTLARKLPKRIH